MKFPLLVALLTTAALAGAATAKAEVAPDWLRSMDAEEETQSVDPAAAVDEATSAASDWPAATGPLLEEYVITDQGVETVEARNARVESDAARTRAAADSSVIESAPVDRTYGVQPGDVLQISVWREPELGREVVVAPDGSINYPLIGAVEVEDKSVEEIGDEIETGLSKFMKQAAVTVTVKELQGNRVYVIGQVNRPGVFPFAKNLDVMQALSLAGGTAKFADLDDIKILRRVAGVQKAFTFNYSKVQSGRNLEQNILLESGDVVMVP